MTTRILAAGGVVAAVVAAVALVRPPGDGRLEPRTETVLDAESIVHAENSPTVLRHPVDGDRLVLVHRVDRPAFGAVLRHSDDGGRTWQRTSLPLPAGEDRPFAPDAAFAADGTLYVVYSNLAGTGNVPDGLWLTRSDDAGRSLSEPVRVAGPLAFQPRIAVDGAGTVHVTWMQAADVGLFRLSGAPNPVVAARSTDGGRTFSDPVRVSDSRRARVGAAVPVVGSGGDLVVVYVDFQDDRRDFENLEGPAWPEPVALVATRSSDGGRTFGAGVAFDSDVRLARRFLVFIPDFPGVAAGPRGEVFVTWSDARSGPEDVLLRRSPDGGRTWEPAERVFSDSDGAERRLPAVAVAPDGRVDVAAYADAADRRRAVVASSWDGGRRFVSLPASSDDFDPDVGPRAHAGLDVDFGSRIAVASDDDSVVVAWTDTRHGSPADGRQEVAVRVLSARAPTGRSSSFVVGTGVSALVLFGVAGWRRRGRPDLRSRRAPGSVRAL